MDVSGNLFSLPQDYMQVPLPWHCRAPLGLRSGTSVHVALVESAMAAGTAAIIKQDPPLYRPPDLLISVLDPNAWNRTRRLVGSSQDGPGLLHNLLQKIHDANHGENYINIELGESCTIPERECAGVQIRHHRTTLYLIHQPFEQAKQILEKCAADSACQLLNLPTTAARLKLYLGETSVNSGLLQLDKDWRAESRKLFVASLMEDLAKSEKAAEEYADYFDFDVAFALADLDARSIRLTFPLRGARRLHTLHTDAPNTAIKITELLHEDYSILGGILAKHDASSAGLYLVVEPMPGKQPLHEKHFQKLNRENAFRKCVVSVPVDYEELLHEKIPPLELARQFVKHLRMGVESKEFIGEFMQLGISNAEAPRSGMLQVELSSQSRLEIPSLAVEMIRQVGSLLAVNPIEIRELEEGNLSLAARMNRLVSANASVFIVWKQNGNFTANPQGHPIRNAMLHSMFASTKSLVLIEGNEEETALRVLDVQALLGNSPKVCVRSFEWTQEHVEAIRRQNADEHTGPCETILLSQNSLYVRITDWLYQFLR